MKLKITTLFTLFMLFAMLSSCSRKNGDTTANYISIKGSDTMVHLAGNWAEEYMKKNEEADISVTGGGSGTGIAALLNGSTAICIASRKIKEKEVTLAKSKGIVPKETITARDGIAIVVNPENGIKVLSIEQISKIYTGVYTNWKDVGGSDNPILVLSRENSSGTYVFFQKRVMNKQDYTKNAMLMPANSAIIQSVSQDKGAIGYVGLGYAMKASSKIKILKVKNRPESKAVLPSVSTVQSAEYPIARPLQFYTNGTPKGSVKAFIDFVLSSQGQKIVLQTGYVPVSNIAL